MPATRLARADDGLAGMLRRAHLTVTGVVLVGVAVAGWSLARWIGARTLYLIVYAWVLTMVAAWFVARRRLVLDVDRSDVPVRMREGQSIPVELRVTAGKRATTVVLEERLPPELGASPVIPVASLAPGETIEHRYAVTPKLRGIYRIGPCTATWSDPFGLTLHDQDLSETIEVIVHPRTEPVHDRVLTRMWEDPPIRPPVSKPWPTGFEFYGMRDYVPGDDLRRIVWSAVAKTDRILVRESEQGITDRVAVVLDTERRWHSPGIPSATFETGVSAVASLGARHLRDGFAVTFLTGEGRVASNLRGAKAEFPFLDELARVQPGTGALQSIASELLTEARRGSHLLLVTPHVDKDTAGTLRLALARGCSVTVAFLVWDESDPQALNRAAALGCEVVQLPVGASLEAMFGHQVGAGIRR